MFTDACCAVAIARHFSVRKLRRALRRLVRSASFHEPSLLSFGLLFVRQRVGGGAPVAELAERLGAGVAAGRRGALAFDELVVRRVFGGRGVEAMACSMRVEMMRMLQTGPVCALAVKLQVMDEGLDGVAAVVWGADGAVGFLQAEARGRVAGGGVPRVVNAAYSGNAEAVELHVIADAGAVNVEGG